MFSPSEEDVKAHKLEINKEEQLSMNMQSFGRHEASKRSQNGCRAALILLIMMLIMIFFNLGKGFMDHVYFYLVF